MGKKKRNTSPAAQEVAEKDTVNDKESSIAVDREVTRLTGIEEVNVDQLEEKDIVSLEDILKNMPGEDGAFVAKEGKSAKGKRKKRENSKIKTEMSSDEEKNEPCSETLEAGPEKNGIVSDDDGNKDISDTGDFSLLTEDDDEPFSIKETPDEYERYSAFVEEYRRSMESKVGSFSPDPISRISEEYRPDYDSMSDDDDIEDYLVEDESRDEYDEDESADIEVDTITTDVFSAIDTTDTTEEQQFSENYSEEEKADSEAAAKEELSDTSSFEDTAEEEPMDSPENVNEAYADIATAEAEDGEANKPDLCPEQYGFVEIDDYGIESFEITEDEILAEELGLSYDASREDIDRAWSETINVPTKKEDEVLDGELTETAEQIDEPSGGTSENSDAIATEEDSLAEGEPTADDTAVTDEPEEEESKDVFETVTRAEVSYRKCNKYNPEKPRIIDWLFDILELLTVTLGVAMLLLTFVIRTSRVDGGSMESTLHDGDQVLLYSLFYTPERGDIIVFEDKTTGNDNPLIKRVIAVEGDTVRIERNGMTSAKVYLNGELLEEDYILEDGSYYRDPSGEWTVGKGEVFVMGDHRNTSKDSREFGVIPIEGILGKVLLRYYPFDSFGGIE